MRSVGQESVCLPPIRQRLRHAHEKSLHVLLRPRGDLIVAREAVQANKRFRFPGGHHAPVRKVDLLTRDPSTTETR